MSSTPPRPPTPVAGRPPLRSATPSMHNADPVQHRTLVQRLKVFRDRLLNIDTRNRSIFLRAAAKKHSFDLAVLDAGLRDACVKRALEGAGEALLLADRDDGDDDLARREHLVTLLRASESLAEETGLHELYVGLCWVEGSLDEQKYMRAPLVLAPATLKVKRDGRKQGVYVVFDGQGEAQLNRAALAAIRKFRNWAAGEDLADKLGELLEGDAAASGEAFYSAFVKMMIDSGMPLEAAPYAAAQPLEKLTAADVKKLIELCAPFNPTGFSVDRSLDSVPVPGKGADAGSATGKEKSAAGKLPLRSAAYAVLGIFPQSSTALFADFEELIDRAQQGRSDQGIVDNLLEAPADRTEPTNGPVDLDAVADAQLNCVLAGDPSQDAIIVKSAKSDCTVVRGPPGTGKSQVIVNLIGDALSRNERVLVVCQKRAALDVVYDRLCGVGLGDTAYLVHDEGADRPAIYKKMAGVLTGRGSPPPPPPTPRPAAGISTTIDDLAGKIRGIVGPLGADWHGGPAYRLYRRIRPGFTSHLSPPDDVVRGDERRLVELATFLTALKPAALRFDRIECAVAGRATWSKLGHSDRQRLIDGFAALARAATDAGDGPVVLLSNDGDYERAISAAATSQSLMRFVSPGWWLGGRSLVASLGPKMGGLPPEKWREPLEKSRAIARALATPADAMTTSWRTAVERRLVEAGGPAKIAAHAGAASAAVAADFHEIKAHDDARAAAAAGFAKALAECAAKLDAKADWAAEVTQEVTFRWIDELEKRHPALGADPFGKYEELRRRIIDLMNAKRKTLATDLVREIRHRALTPTFSPDEQAAPNRKAATDWNKLAYELEKKRRLKPLRTLLAEFAWPMRNTAGVWMASPEVVSEVFPLTRGLFDLVVFDEASQLAVERAIPVVYRGKRTVIAGDEQQMPPSRLFQSMAGGDEDEDQESEIPADESAKIESLLMLAKRIYGFDYLSWHYRSRYPDLIEFSNHGYYEGRLTVGATTERLFERTPIEWIAAAGKWDSRTNKVEVGLAVDVLTDQLTRARDKRFRSVGLITFNEPQQEAILNEIDRRRAADPAFAELMTFAENPKSGKHDDKPFVKNIENVQGDERDVIIFSVGYAPGADGVFRRQFGSLSVEGGENRLNVAVTRARQRMIVICSFEPEKLKVDDIKSMGTRRLRQFLEYAKAVGERRTAAAEKVKAELNPASTKTSIAIPLDGGFETELERSLADALAAEGYKVEPRVGVGEYRLDLGVAHPSDESRWCLGIESDGAAFHSGRSVRERDVARSLFLQSRGWKLARVWGRSWWLGREKELERVRKELLAAAGTGEKKE